MAETRKEYIDDLTGLYNRRYLYKKANEEIKKARRADSSLSLVIIDLDHFKDINDSYGHSRGDSVLIEFARFLKNSLRQNDLVFRFGGDEFICILPNADYQQAERICQRLIEKCRANEIAGIGLTLSIGIASFPTQGQRWQELFDIADRNLYTAKRRGRDQIGVFEKTRKGLIIPVPEIVGRENEMIKIKEYINSVFNKSGGAVCVRGEVGVGKTRLIHAVIKDSRYRDFQFWESNLSIATHSIPYYPFREIILGISHKAGKECLRKLPLAYQVEIKKIVPDLANHDNKTDETVFMLDKFRLFEGVRRFFSYQSQKTPLFIFLDNIHWLDDDSLELLHYLLRMLKNEPIFFFFVYRIEESKSSFFQNTLSLMAREGLYEQIDLELLQTADVHRLISLMMDSAPSPELTEYVVRKTGGNPFFIEELMKTLEAQNILYWDDERWVFDRSKDVTIPHTVKSVFEQKLGMLNKDGQMLLEYAAVIGRPFDFTFLQKITGFNEGQLFDVLDKIIGLRLLKEGNGGRYYFAEDMIREIIYQKIGSAEQKHYHQVVGEWLLELNQNRLVDVVEELAHHFYRGGIYDRAIEYCLIAGNRAKDVYANQSAVKFYTWALESLKESTIVDKKLKEIEILKKRAEAFNFIGEYIKAKKDLNDAIATARETRNMKYEADCRILYAIISQTTGQYKEAIQQVRLSLKIYKSLKDKNGELSSFICLGNVYNYCGKYQEALKFYSRSLKRAIEIGDRKSEGMILNNIGTIKENLGLHSTALKLYQRALKVSEETNNLELLIKVLNNMGVMYTDLGDYTKALEFHQRVSELAIKIGSREAEAANFCNLGIIHHSIGDYYKALNFYQQSLEITKELGHCYGTALNLDSMGSLYSKMGDYHKALDFHQQALKIRTDVGDTGGESQSLSNIGEIYKNLGEYSQALEFYQRSLKIAEEFGYHNTMAVNFMRIAEALIEMGDFLKARRYLERSLKLAEKIESKLLQAQIFLIFAHLYLERNEVGQAKRALNKFLFLADDLVLKEMKGEFVCLSARLYAQEKKWNKAKASFKEAISIFNERKEKLGLGKVYYYQGMMYKEIGDKINKRRCLNRALEIFKALGAKGWSQKIN